MLAGGWSAIALRTWECPWFLPRSDRLMGDAVVTATAARAVAQDQIEDFMLSSYRVYRDSKG